ncbi:unnamed protein product, partial [Effrenium voratum]
GNVVNSALAMGVSYILFWETYCNECHPGPGCSSDGRCRQEVGVADMQRLNGFWLLRPDGRRSWFGEYLAAKLREAPEEELLALRGADVGRLRPLPGLITLQTWLVDDTLKPLALLVAAAAACGLRCCRVHS